MTFLATKGTEVAKPFDGGRRSRPLREDRDGAVFVIFVVESSLCPPWLAC